MLGENDRGSYHHSTSSSFHPLRCLNAPRLLTIDFCFIVFIFHSNAIPNEITVLQGRVIERPCRLWLIPTEPRGCGSNNGGGILFPLTLDLTCKRSSTASCRQVSSFLSWHSHYDALWMARQSPMVASQLVMCRERWVCLLVGLHVIHLQIETESKSKFFITFYVLIVFCERPKCNNELEYFIWIQSLFLT